MHRKSAIQLMIGPDELRLFGERGVLDRLGEAQRILGFTELYLAVGDPSSRLARLVIERCKDAGSSVALWTMVMADTGRLGAPPAVDARGLSGHGKLGAWSELGKGEESFLFSCPSHELRSDEGPELAVQAARAAGADAIFLDRIRYPSPSNGLEFLGACSCDACRARYGAEVGGDLPDLAALAAREARSGAAGASRFIERARPVLSFRAATIAAVAGRYALAAGAAGLALGLDLFAPSLAALVGQDYGLLARHADFIKAMLYCKSRGPACLPLELSCLVEGLRASGAPLPAAREFVAALVSLPLDEIASAPTPSGLPAERAAREYDRAAAAIAASGAEAELRAGIELVDYPGYGTRISAADRDAYLGALGSRPITASWNLLYISDAHLEALARSAARAGGTP